MKYPSLVGQLPIDWPIVTYCIHSAHRAPEAAKMLRGLGFQSAYVLEGAFLFLLDSFLFIGYYYTRYERPFI